MAGRKPQNKTRKAQTDETLKRICERAGFVTDTEALHRIIEFYDGALEVTREGGKIIHTHPITGEKTRLIP